jgi:Ca-activated chloride channel homolog
MRSATVVLLAMSALVATPPVAADAPHQFRGSTELVPVYTTVQDRQGRLVPDLRKEDFAVSDNGKEQPIAFFSNEVTPFTVVVMLDQSHSMQGHQEQIGDAASAFVKELSSDDKARIGRLGYRVTLEPQEFTGQKETLLSFVRRSPGDAGASPVWLSIDMSITALYGLEGRRVILIMTDGHDHPAGNQPRTTFKDVADRVRRANVMVYAIGFAATDSPGEKDKPDERLRLLADLSGGGYFEMNESADLTELFKRVAEELHHQYWIGFEPAKRDGKVHDIKVRVKRPGMTARARQSYVAPDK